MFLNESIVLKPTGAIIVFDWELLDCYFQGFYTECFRAGCSRLCRDGVAIPARPGIKIATGKSYRPGPALEKKTTGPARPPETHTTDPSRLSNENDTGPSRPREKQLPSSRPGSAYCSHTS